MHEKDMLEGLRNKEINALHFLIEKYSRLIYKVIHNVLHSQHDKHVIDEVVNDVFMMVWENADRFDESRGHFQSWLIAIAKYKAIDYKRKNSKRVEFEKPLDERLAKDDDYIDYQDDIDRFLKIIRHLPEKDRIIFIKRYLNEESIEEIANQLQIQPNNVYQKLSRGRKRIKTILRGEENV
ncbi:sigma-70 family RNA polymerase sigma factor [Heyndrickxia oleronia]|uniref:sigma-70 family RNA polymerase sigma factor n=1 Tax=Heyndrickxia oleronia TaxID=38875 RepID=UPI0020420908|nr:sigma-70 family RNA polymerase sigma factor [Heyndrickxia oleronia]MCM3454532.1 sigma-70 family RNA polymerase sigma factor [Heyndrickxia oleronia]